MGDASAAPAAPSRPAVDLAALAAARLARLREALAEARLDGVVLTSPEAVTYATGYRSVGGSIFRGHAMAGLVTADQWWLVAPAADCAAAVDAGVPVDRIVPFGRFYFESADGSPLAQMADVHPELAPALRVAVRTALGQGARVGVEGGGSDAAVTAVLDELQMSSRDAGHLLARVRGVKLPEEVTLLRHAARLAETGVEAALAHAGPGVTESELASMVATTMVAGGGEPRFVVATVGEGTALADAYPTQREWRHGQLARFDVGCIYGGYWSDMARTAVLGDPDELQAHRYAALLAGEEEQLSVARPGITAGELFASAVGVVERHGLRPYRRHHCGHGIGLAVYEPPIVSPGVETPLRPGMTFCFETPYYEVGWGGMMVEDTVVVTENGVELLTSTSRDLRVVTP